MSMAVGSRWQEWHHRRQPSTVVAETLVVETGEESSRVTLEEVTEGVEFETMEIIKRVLREPEKYPGVDIIFAENS